MCLEEMFSTTVSEGAIFYGETRRREVVAITEELKNEVCQIFEEMHQYYDRRYTPKVKYSKACASCSLKEICLPKLEKAGSVKEYLKRALEEERDEKTAQYIVRYFGKQHLGLDGENIVVYEEQKELGRLPLHNLEGIVSFGYRGTSPALMGACADRNISLCYLTPQENS